MFWNQLLALFSFLKGILSLVMNKNIIIGCPYTSMSNIDMAFKEIGIKNITVVNCDDVTAIDLQTLSVKNGDSYEINSFYSSFIRYPYDLIPPHSSSFALREEIEYHKTLALALDSVSINHLASTWMLRNRSYSLSQVHGFGINIAEYVALRKENQLVIDNKKVVKALGNCFVSDDIGSLNSDINNFVKVEEDDGDVAAVFPASLLEDKSIKLYLSNIGVAFLQQYINSVNEYRGYIIGNTSFVYVRDQIDAFDKSTAKYVSTTYNLTNKTISGLNNLMTKFKMQYLCFDFLLTEANEEIIIDINPYGSMPKYSEYPAPSLQLAKLLMGMAD